MSASTTALVLLAMLAAPASWLLPRAIALDAFAAWTLAVIYVMSPETATWMVAANLIAFASMRAGERSGAKGLFASLAAMAIVAGLVFSEFSRGHVWIGLSFSALRLLHVLGEWWMGRLPPPSLRDLARYQFFLPVLVVGPIHRLPNFQRQTLRRRFDWPDLLAGLERCLVGGFMAYVVGDVVLGRFDAVKVAHLGLGQGFAAAWLLSAVEWIRLYFVFAGLSAVALGTSRMMGLRLEENFNRPWQAENLLDFWSRWHMSLTEWSRDYVFRPVMAITRSPVLGVFAAMLIIGLWHEISVYYVLWSFWQAAGILLSRFAGKRIPLNRIHEEPRQIIVFAGILGWLSLARPVITLLLERVHDAAFALP